MTTVTVVTPWLDHLELVDDYRAAIAGGGPPDLVAVVDNGSTPPLPFATIRFEENCGFAAASNIGLGFATTDAVLFLNNDIAVTEHGWLDELRDALEPGVLVGARMRHDAHADVDGHKFPYLDGWCLAGMRDELLGLGGFDDTLREPAYFSDNLLCLRARLAGMTLREVPVGLIHKENVTAGPGNTPSVWDAYVANHLRYVWAARAALRVAV